jgi:predicted transposase YdaD
MEQAEQKMEQAAKAEKQRLTKAVHAFLAMGKDIAFIAGVLDLSIEETNNLAQLH